MNVFLTKDKLHYRKWMHIIFNLLLNGSAHYLSGRKKAGIIWFASMLIFQLGLAIVLPSMIHFGVGIITPKPKWRDYQVENYYMKYQKATPEEKAKLDKDKIEKDKA
jgi:hypothetical protein